MEKSNQNQHEERNPLNIEERKGKSKKKWEFFIPLLILIVLIASVFVFFKHKQHKQETALIEEMTVELLAQYKCNGYIYQDGGNMIQQILQSGQITSNGYEGAGMDPLEINDYVEEQLNTLNHKSLYTTDFSITSSQKPTAFLLNDKYQTYFESARKNTNVVLSKLESVETTGDTKMWTYTEMNSGVDFIATKDGKGLITVKATKEGASMCYNLYIKQYEETFQTLYTEYRYTVSNIATREREERERAESNRRDRDDMDALLGLGLMGLFL